MREGNTQIGKWKSRPPEAPKSMAEHTVWVWLCGGRHPSPCLSSYPWPSSTQAPIYGPAGVYMLASNRKPVAEPD